MQVNKDRIRKTLDHAKAYLDEPAPLKLSEADTKIYFLEPIIAALGWEGLGVVTREYFVKSSQEFIDYMMAVDGKRVLAIEAKPLQSPLNEKNAAQLVQYCAVEGVEWAALTNGCELQFFNTFLKPDLNAKRVMSLDLLSYSGDEEFDALVQQLSQLSRESITSPGGASTWLRQRRMDSTLRAALFDSNSPAVKALRKALNDAEIKATAPEIVHWARTHLASKAGLAKPPVAPPLPPLPTPNPGNEGLPADDVELKDSYIFQGPHLQLFPTFQALQSRIESLAPGTVWRVMKHYIAAGHKGNTFLVIKRREGALVIGLSVPEGTNSPLFQNDPKIFRWERITKALAISKVTDLTDEVIDLIQLAVQNATGGQTAHKHYFGVTMGQLLGAGLLQPGDHLILTKGQTKITEATLHASGKIEWQGQLYSSPSDRVFTEATGRKSMNGWTHWFVERDGGLLSLADLRGQFMVESGISDSQVSSLIS